MFESNADEIDEAESALIGNNSNDFEDAWALLAPGAEEERNDEENVCPLLEDDDQLVANFDELCHSNIQNISNVSSDQSAVPVLVESGSIKEDMLSQLEILNKEQQQIFYNVRKWCVQKLNGMYPAPFFTYVNGSGGVGKSHLIRCIVYEADKILGPLKSNVKELQIVVLAPTGTAAHNVNGNTLHSFFHLPIKMGLPYMPLSESSLNTLRCNLDKLSLIIIDEIWKVNSNKTKFGTVWKFLHNFQ